MDVREMEDSQLVETQQAVQAEIERRAIVTDAQRRTDDMCLAYLQASGRVNGSAYVQPVGFIGAYPTGWRVTHEGDEYDATVPGATGVPGQATDWAPATGDMIPFWESGEYEAGAMVRDAGRIWEALTVTDGARPSEMPAAWKAI